MALDKAKFLNELKHKVCDRWSYGTMLHSTLYKGCPDELNITSRVVKKVHKDMQKLELIS